MRHELRGLAAIVLGGVVLAGCAAPTDSDNARYHLVRIGMSRAQVQHYYGVSPDVFWKYDKGLAYFVSGRLASFSAFEPDKQLGVPIADGSSEAEVQAAIGQPRVCDFYVLPNFRFDEFCYGNNRVVEKMTGTRPVP